VVPVTVSKFPAKRLTINPRVIKASKSVFLLVTGAEKGHVLSKALENPEDVETLPVWLVLNATWILDEEAEIEFNKITHA
jgi:6-phosphogluconolactonase/glucosamine-6-phosphate isomerase/deaminase